MEQITGLFRRRGAGQGTVEFALVVPLFLLLLLGVLEFSWALYTQTTLVHAAEEGVRRGMVLSSSSQPDPFMISGNQTGTYLAPIACDRNTIVGTAACYLGGVAPARTTALVCPSNTLDCPTLGKPPQTVGKVELQLNHQYRAMILGFFPGLDNIVITGHAEGRTQ